MEGGGAGESRRAGGGEKGGVRPWHDPNLAPRPCDHVVLLFADGHAQAGPVSLRTGERLTRLYRHPLRAVETGQGRLFVTE